MKLCNQKYEAIKETKEAIERIEKEIHALEDMRAVQVYLLQQDLLKRQKQVLKQLELARYSEETSRFYEPINYGNGPFYQDGAPVNYFLRPHIDLETFLKRSLLYAHAAGRDEMSYQELEELHCIVSEEFKKDAIYEDEPYRDLTNDIRLYLDPQNNEIDFCYNQDRTYLMEEIVKDVLVTKQGEFFFHPNVDYQELEKQYGLSSFQTERERKSFTCPKVAQFFGITFDERKQAIKKIEKK